MRESQGEMGERMMGERIKGGEGGREYRKDKEMGGTYSIPDWNTVHYIIRLGM